MNMEIRRGDIFEAKLEAKGSVQGGKRPVIIWSNNLNNKYCPTINIIPLSAQIEKVLPMHVNVCKDDRNGLDNDSIALLEQIQTINKSQLVYKIGYTDSITMRKLEKAARLQQGMIRPVDLKKINEWLYFINELKTKLSNTDDEFYRRNLSHVYQELKDYCDNYDLNFKTVIESRMIKEITFTKNGAVISV